VLGLSWLFYEAQRSGKLPANHRVAWRRSAHLTDAVPGGWYDAGDYIKLNFPLASTVSLLSWGVLEFKDGYAQAGELQHALDNLFVAVDYLLRCHIAPRKYIGQIGHPGRSLQARCRTAGCRRSACCAPSDISCPPSRADIDHDFWGRPEQEKTARPAFVYDSTKPAADLMGKVSAALASASMVYRSVNATYAAELLTHAKELWRWGAEKDGARNSAQQRADSPAAPACPLKQCTRPERLCRRAAAGGIVRGAGKYSDSYQSATKSIYASSDTADDMAWGAAWLWRATGDSAYVDAAVRYWDKKDWDVTMDWDNSGAAVAVLLANEAADGKTVPNAAKIQSFVTKDFVKAWVESNGAFSQPAHELRTKTKRIAVGATPIVLPHR
jgi:hypothetical protein